MFGVSELKQTRVYQEAKAEGKAEGEQSLLLKLLTRRIGTIDQQWSQKFAPYPWFKLKPWEKSCWT
jgi:predicted transposase YdaD